MQRERCNWSVICVKSLRNTDMESLMARETVTSAKVLNVKQHVLCQDRALHTAIEDSTMREASTDIECPTKRQPRQCCCA
eukprot:1641737-Rhodomonas_salina.1